MTEPIQIELPTIFQMKTVNAWLFLEPKPVLIDCGEKTESSWKALQKGLAKYGLTIRDLKKVIITHSHVDHMGMAGKITEHSDAEIWVSDMVYDWAVDLEEMWRHRANLILNNLEKTLGNSEVGKNIMTMIRGFLQAPTQFWDNINPERLQTFRMDGKLNFGNADWDIIHAPGHCINQTIFYEPKSQFLLSADMLLAITPTPVIDSDPANPERRNKGLVQMLASYEKLSNLKISKVFPGHFDAFKNAQQVIDFQVNRIQNRKEECFDLIKSGVHQFLPLFEKMYAKSMNLAGTSMLIGYLDLLMEENRIEENIDGGMVRYYLKD